MTLNRKLQISFLSLLLFSSMSASGNHPEKEHISITLTGELASKSPTWVKAPSDRSSSYQIVYMPDEGAFVEKGDTIVIFETNTFEQNMEEKKESLEQKEQELKELRLNNLLSIEKIENEIITNAIEESLAVSRLEQAQYNSLADQQDAELDLKKIRLGMKATKQKLESQKVINENKEEEKVVQIDQYKQAIENYQKLINRLNIKSPKSGIIVHHEEGFFDDEEKITIGSTIWPTGTILQIPDLDHMIVKININEVDITKIEIGQKAQIEVLAYPDTVFSGEVTYISKIAEEVHGSNLKMYPIELQVNSGMNKRLKPGLTVKTTITIQEFSEGFSIPCWCLFHEGNNFFVKYDKKRIPVEVVKLCDGKAYIIGQLNTEMELIENRNIPNF